MAGNDDHFCADSPDLVYFFSSVKDALGMISGTERPPAAAATKLIVPIRVEFDPVLMALIHDEPTLLIIPVTESFFRLPAVIAGVMICCQIAESGSIQLNSAFLYVLDNEIEYGDRTECTALF